MVPRWRRQTHQPPDVLLAVPLDAMHLILVVLVGRAEIGCFGLVCLQRVGQGLLGLLPGHLLLLDLRDRIGWGRQTGRETGRWGDGVTGRQGDRETDRETGRKGDRQKGRQADRQTARQADRQADREIGRQAERETGRQRQRERETGRQDDRKTGRQADS